MTFKHAYLRLTAFYVLIVMIISVGFSAVLYRVSSSEIGRGLGQQARVLREHPVNVNAPFPIQELEKIRLDQLEESGNHLRMNLVYFNLLILVLSSVVSYFLAKRTLRPIELMVEAQNRFTADASHELKTPLTAMRSEIEVSLRGKKMNLAEAKKLLGSNLEEIGKLETLSNALLKLAKYQEESKLEFKPVSLPEAVTEAYEKVESLAKEKSIEFKNSFEEVEVLGDRQSLVELFVILLDNAIKYSPKKSPRWASQSEAGGSEISIEIEKQDKQALVKVADHGAGIKKSELPFIFNRFYRADSSRNKEKADGYGLGLSIAKAIVELHGGAIEAKSEQGKGSEFTVTLSASR